MEILISSKLVSMNVKNFYGEKNWAAIAGGENVESNDDFLQDSDSDKDYEPDQFPPCDSSGDDSSDSGKFLYSYFEKKVIKMSLLCSLSLQQFYSIS